MFGRPGHRLAVAVVVTAASIATLTSCSSSHGPAIDVTPTGSLIAIGKRVQAGDATAQDVKGAPVPLAPRNGRPTFINFFASWCRPCKAETPGLERAYRAFDGEVNFIGVNTKDEKSAGAQFAKSYGITYDVVYDEDGTSTIKLGNLRLPLGVPYSVLIDRDGKIAALYAGPVLPADLRRVFPSLLGSAR